MTKTSKKTAIAGVVLAATVGALSIAPRLLSPLPFGCELKEAVSSDAVMAVAICPAPEVSDGARMIFWPKLSGYGVWFRPCGDAGVCERWRAP